MFLGAWIVEMKTHCIRHTLLPHTSRLFADYLYDFERVSRFYARNPHDPEAYRAAANSISFPEARRTALVDALREQNGDSALLARLAKPGTAAVVTGQQVGLFSGPSYTIYKALTAVKLAADLSAKGIDAVPIFWLATEDHDFAEVNHVWAFDPAHRPVQFVLRQPAPDHRPVGTIPLDGVPIDALRGTLDGFPFGAEVVEMVAAAYTSGRTMGQAFSALLKRLLGTHEVLILDPMHPASRRLAAPLLAEAVRLSPELKLAVTERGRELEAAGYHVQVHVEPETSFFFLLEDGKRLTLRRHKGEWIAGDRRFSPNELAARGQDLSPNALLRPVVQDSMMPTVAYIGGPAEIAYLAQSQPLYERLLGRMPVAVPRAGFTLLDARASKLMDRYGLRLEDCQHGQEHLEEAIAARLIPPALAQRFVDTREAVVAQLDALGAELALFDPTLAASLDRSRAKILYQLSKAQHKAERETFRRSERAREEAAYLAGLISPQKHLQERLYTILPFLARHGLDLVDRLYENVHLGCPDHLLAAV